MSRLSLFDPLQRLVEALIPQFENIPPERTDLLKAAATYLKSTLDERGRVSLVFICTHNSRRSHMAQVWAMGAAAYYGVEGIFAYSGGTEATACNPRTIRAMRRAGFQVVDTSGGDNPIYLVQFADMARPVRVFSKEYADIENPQEAFAAMMCCSSADEACPVVLGAEARFSTQYEDPKVSDDTPREAECYDERLLQIAREMLFLLSLVRPD